MCTKKVNFSFRSTLSWSRYFAINGIHKIYWKVSLETYKFLSLCSGYVKIFYLIRCGNPPGKNLHFLIANECQNFEIWHTFAMSFLCFDILSVHIIFLKFDILSPCHFCVLIHFLFISFSKFDILLPCHFIVLIYFPFISFFKLDILCHVILLFWYTFCSYHFLKFDILSPCHFCVWYTFCSYHFWNLTYFCYVILLFWYTFCSYHFWNLTYFCHVILLFYTLSIHIIL